MALLLSQIGAPPLALTGIPFIRIARWDDWIRSGDEPTQQQLLSRGSFAAAVVAGTGVPRWLVARLDEARDDHARSRFLDRSRGEDRFLHRLRVSNLSPHEQPDGKIVQQFFRKGVGEDPFRPRLRVVGTEPHDRGDETAIPLFLKRGRGEDPSVPVLLGQYRFVDTIPPDTAAGQFLSRGSFLFVAPNAPTIHFLALNGIAHDAFVFDDYAVLFPSRFIHVGSDAVPPVAPGNPTSWQYLARTKGRWGR